MNDIGAMDTFHTYVSDGVKITRSRLLEILEETCDRLHLVESAKEFDHEVGKLQEFFERMEQ